MEKNVFLNILEISHENTCVRVFFNKVAGLQALGSATLQVFSREISEVFKNTFFEEHVCVCLFPSTVEASPD